MSAISGVRRAAKEMADGTLRVQIDIDPQYRKQFHDLFPEIDMPVALAPLRIDQLPEVPEVEAPKSVVEPSKGGELARLAGLLCVNQDFRTWFWSEGLWCTPSGQPVVATDQDEEGTAEAIRQVCGIQSRAELDHNSVAAAIFHERIRRRYHLYQREPG